MKNVIQLLSRLRRMNIKLHAVGDRLRFDGPKSALNPELIEELRTNKAALLVFLKQANAGATQPITRRDPSLTDLPLSFAQQRLWFLNQLEPDSVAYNVPTALRLTGKLHIPCLENCLHEIIGRHESLRTTFHATDGHPVQHIAGARTLSLPLTDLAAHGEALREDFVQRLAERESQHLFDLEKGPLLRAHLIRLEVEVHIFLFTMHHIISDGWSSGVIIRELGSLYQAFVKDGEAVLEPLPVQYADFACWQHQWLNEDILEDQRNYWRHQLEGTTELIELPYDRKHPPIQNYRGAKQDFSLDEDRVRALKALAQGSGCTLFTVLASAFLTLLCRYSGQEDLTIGTPVANRNRKELEPLIGFFVNTLALRVNLSGNPGFEELLSRVRAVVLDAFVYQDLPFEHVVEAIKPERNLSIAPFFQIMFALQNITPEDLELPGLTLSSMQMDHVTAKFDLILIMTESQNEILGTFEYNIATLESETITRVIRHLGALLAGIAADPQTAIFQLPMLTEVERQELLEQWNTTPTEPSFDSALSLFETHADRQPDHPALIWNAMEISYSLLSAMARQISGMLGTKNGEDPITVAVLTPNPPLMIACWLGILRAGDVVLPLNPEDGRERIGEILNDSAARILLNEDKAPPEVPAFNGRTVLMPRNWEAAPQDLGSPPRPVVPSSQAFAFYPSDAKPKVLGYGRSVEAVLNECLWYRGLCAMDSGSRVLQLFPLSSGAALRNVLTSLVSGASLILCSGPPTDSYEVLDLIRQHQIQIVNGLPSILNPMFALCEREDFQPLVTLRRLIFSGAAARVGRTRRWLETDSCQARIANIYELEAVGGGLLCHRLPRPDDDQSCIPIGEPVAGVHAYIVDSQMNPVPLGVAGELLIGTPELEYPFIKQASIQRRILDDPFCKKQWVYRTFDLVKRLADGPIKFLGGMHEATKVKGYRIDLREIEAVLAKHESVADAATMVREDNQGKKLLVAYVSRAPAGPSKTELEQSAAIEHYLNDRLPSYMLPHAVVILESLPLTLDGKLHARVLPRPLISNKNQVYAPPKTETEHRLATIWSKVLKQDQIGIHNNFFALGGSSLLATQIVSRIKDEFVIDLALREIFLSPTVAGLSTTVDELRQTSAASKIPPPRPIARHQPLALSHAQQRLWFLDQLEPGEGVYTITGGLRLMGRLATTYLERGFRDITDRHEATRTTFSTLDEEPVQIIHPPGPVAFTLIDLGDSASGRRDEALKPLIQRGIALPFDLERGPLLRYHLFRISAEEHALLVTMHHIISDGWSIGILIRELAAFYPFHLKQSPLSLPKLEIQYADYASWQGTYLEPLFQDQLGYWKAQLEGAPTLHLPSDHPRPRLPSYRGKLVPISVNPNIAGKINRLARDMDATLFMVLETAFTALLSKYSGQTDICIGMPNANRNHQAIEPLIGFFVNTLVLRHDLGGDPSFEELVNRGRGVTLEAFSRQDISFERVVEAVQPQRALNRSPLFQVSFVLQNVPMETPSLPGLKLIPLATEHSTAKFDLTLSISETPNGLLGGLEYSTDLFEETTARTMMDDFQSILAIISDSPKQRLSELPQPSGRHHDVRRDGKDSSGQRRKADQTPPRTQTEKQVHTIWAEILGREEIGIHANFFELGGYSLLGIKIVSRIRKRLDMDLPLRDLFIYPTLAALCSRLEEIAGQTLEREEVPNLVPVPRDQPLELSFAQNRLWFLHQLQGPNPAYNISVALGLHGLVNSSILEHALGEIVRRHEILRTSFVSIKNKPYQHIHRANAMALPLIDLMGLSPSQRVPTAKRLAGQEDRYLFKLEKESLFRLRLLRLADREYVLLVNMHHIISDGWSMEVLIGELTTLYGGYLKDVESPIHPLPIQYADFAHWQKAYLQGRRLEKQLEYWRAQLAEAPLLRLPLDHPRPSIQTYRGNQVSFHIQPELTEALQKTSQAAKATLFMTLQATYALLLSYYSGQQDICIGTPVANRNRGEIEPLIGFFVNTVVLRNDTSGDPEFWVFLESVRQVLLDAFAHQDMPFEYLVETLQPQRRLDYSPLFQTVLVLQARPSGEIDLAGVRMTPFPTQRNAAKFDLTMSLMETKRGLVGSLEYNPDLFSEATILEMVSHYRILIEEIAAQPHRRLSEMPLPVRSYAHNTDVVEERTERTSARESGPRTATEKRVAAIWAQLLAVETVPLGANFFDLGGHSLLGTQMMSMLREAFSLEIALRDLFVHPTVAGLSRHIDGLKSDRRALSTGPPIQREPRDQPIPLSFAQQRLWFLYQLEGANPAYNMPTALRLRGMLCLPVLEQAVAAIERRHESLRTTFDLFRDQPVQVIHPEPRVPIPLVDLERPAKREAELGRWIRAAALQPFDLKTGPLLRVWILRLAAEEHVLALNIHHIISDGWSAGVFIREIGTLYGAFLEGKPNPLPELPIQYADFAIWQRRYLGGDKYEQQISYWRRQLGGAPSLLSLPTDRPRPRMQTYRGAMETFHIDKALTHSLKDLSKRNSTTLFMTLDAMFALLLSYYSGQEDIVLGSPIANRNRGETEKLIGFFVNTLVLRNDLSGNPSFEQLLRRVKQMALDAYEHQDIPFEQVVEAVQPERNLSHAPLFQVMIMLQNTPPIELELPGLSLSGFEGEIAVEKFDMTLSLAERNQTISAAISHNRDLFDKTTIQRLIAHLQKLISELVAGPERPISSISLLDDKDYQLLTQDWKGRTRAYAPAQGVVRLFEKQVARVPNAEALVFASPTGDEEKWTYRQVNQRANEIARQLHGHRAGPRSLIGVCLARGGDLVAALLGVLKAGAAYLPLDAEHPRQRLAYILKDSGASLLLTERAYSDRFPDCGTAILYLDEVATSAEALRNLGLAHEPERLAYTIYTSGSTGRPKGVAISHRALTNFLNAMRHALAIGQHDTLLAVTTVSFDIAGLELLLPLIQGGRVLLASRETAFDGFRLSALLRRYEPDFMQATPATWHSLLAAGWQGASELRILCGGETFPAELAFALLDKGRMVFNLYGPTETTIWSSMAPVERAEIERYRAVSIGKPIDNTQLYLTDRYLQLVPVGVTGRLFIGGDGLARGYHGRPALTAERFVPNPLAREAGVRLYQTGDLARFLPSGKMLYSGREDFQVKLRGFRIELSEIEAVLVEHPRVEQAVATVRQENGGPRLAAYVTVKFKAPGTELSESNSLAKELKTFLGGKLPEYMIPASLVVLSQFPLTPNGKIDRKGLPSPNYADGQNDSPPRTATEKKLAAIWREILVIESVGIHANFFQIGGHSLLATRLVSRIRQDFSVEIPLRYFFSAPTIAAIGETIETLSKEKGPLSAPLRPVPRDRPLALSYGQQRMWFLDKLEPGNSAYHMPIALKFEGLFDILSLVRCVTEIANRHENLRVSFPAVDGKPALSISAFEKIEPIVIDLSPLTPAPRAQTAKKLQGREIGQPFDLSTGPLFRVRLLRLAAEEHVFLTTMHHIISDAWSLGILVNELISFYRAFSGGGHPDPPQLPVQYADYAHWQQAYLQSGEMERQATYWKSCLRGAPPLLELPTDRTRPRIQTYRGNSTSFHIGAETRSRLAALGQETGATIFMVLHAALAQLLSRYSGQSDILIGVPVANRTRSEVEPLIGLFVNTLVLRTDLSGNPPFSQYLQRVQRSAIDAYANQDIPFERVVDAIQPQRNLSFSPIFQVMFVLQNAPMSPLNLPGLTIGPLVMEAPAAKFDLTLNINESPHGINGTIIFNADLFEKATIDRMTNHFRYLLEATLENPAGRISSTPLASVAEQELLLLEWNGASANLFAAHCMHHLFEARTARHPDRAALAFGSRAMTFDELDTRANQVAARLLELGIRAETPVGICMDRSLEMIVALLATLKSGGYYIPMDPAYPAERVQFMLADARVRVLLTTDSVANPIVNHDTTLVVLDRERIRLDPDAGENPARSVEPGHLAYAIYTSGSTGKPKGVMIEHRSIYNYFSALLERLQLERGWSYAMVTTIAADLGLTVLYPALCHGGLLHILESHLLVNPEKFADYFEAHPIDCLKIVPSHLAALLSASRPESVLPRRLLILGGEASRQKWIQTICELAPRHTIINHYGPTEATVGSLTYRLDCDSPLPDAVSLPLGRPLANTRTYVLDRRLNPTPLGVPGELCIAGLGLARGYARRPDLTAARFVPNPFYDPAPTFDRGRLYKTGDRVRFREAGEGLGLLLEFLGRLDHQVKLRGFRVELGEIENTLRELDEVADAVVIVGHDPLGQQNLIGYLVPNSGREISSEAPRQYLIKRLPTYMIPVAFLILDSLPLTANGKLAVHRLPKLTKAARSESKEFVAPRNETEEEIAKIWCELLRLDKVGIHDSFFELGGHSLLVTQILSRINEHFGVELSVRYLFEEPTVASIAEYIESVRWVAEDSEDSELITSAVGQEEGEI